MHLCLFLSKRGFVPVTFWSWNIKLLLGIVDDNKVKVSSGPQLQGQIILTLTSKSKCFLALVVNKEGAGQQE